MARGTAHQVELLRAEVGTVLQTGLEGIRNNTDNLRTELTATLAAGLSEHRDEFFEAIAREQQEASRAHQDNRSLHRQLANLRAELSALQNSIHSPPGVGHGESPRPAIDSPEAVSQPAGVSPEVDSQNDAIHSPGDDANDGSVDTAGLPSTGPTTSDRAAEPTTFTVSGEAARSDSEETTVSETTPADNAQVTPNALTNDQLSQIAAEVAAKLATSQGSLSEPVAPELEMQSAEVPALEPITVAASPEDQARLIATEVAAQLADLLRPSVAAAQDVEAESKRTEAVAQEQASSADDLPSRYANDVSDLIPEPFVWENHVSTLRRAAAVKTVSISCHPETWDFLAAQVEGADHFSKPVNDSNEDTVLSGRSTLALLNALRETVCSGLGKDTGIETWTLAVTSYERIAAVINSTRPADDQVGSDRLQQPHIVLDDRSGTGSPAVG